MMEPSEKKKHDQREIIAFVEESPKRDLMYEAFLLVIAFFFGTLVEKKITWR